MAYQPTKADVRSTVNGALGSYKEEGLQALTIQDADREYYGGDPSIQVWVFTSNLSAARWRRLQQKLIEEYGADNVVLMADDEDKLGHAYGFSIRREDATPKSPEEVETLDDFETWLRYETQNRSVWLKDTHMRRHSDHVNVQFRLDAAGDPNGSAMSLVQRAVNNAGLELRMCNLEDTKLFSYGEPDDE